MSFAKERSRRENAGNRMQALLDQQAELEDLFEKESLSDDEEFLAEAEDEVQDTVDSDFDTESSEEEHEQALLGAQEDKAIEKQERRARRPKPISAATMRYRPAEAPRQKESSTPRTPRERRTNRTNDALRQSSRSTTVQSRLHVEEQIRQYQNRKSSIAKRDRPVTRRLTQEELLAEAEVTERENKVTLEQWLEKEAEKKDKAKKKEKKEIVGPFVRYISFTDGDMRPRRRRLILIEPDKTDKDANNVQTEITDPQVIAWHEKRDLETSEMEGRNLITFVHHRHLQQQQQQQRHIPSISGLTDRELDRTDLIPELADWVDRPLRPTKPMLCPITGLPARYKDPKTNVPYANLDAYKKIQACLSNQMVWSPGMKLYVGEPIGAANVPNGWYPAIAGEKPRASSSSERPCLE
ncbi:YL1 nuclear protein-domain-containing protein [Dichotomocladium elegans]|nr:YL1 nuclear protein-domain-containing protein [Dichotomocladium elegans]